MDGQKILLGRGEQHSQPVFQVSFISASSPRPALLVTAMKLGDRCYNLGGPYLPIG